MDSAPRHGASFRGNDGVRLAILIVITMAVCWPHKGMKMNTHLSVRAELVEAWTERRVLKAVLPVTSAVHPSTVLRANGLVTLFSE